MAFTMHSHSGQFCPGHAKDSLEDVIQYAISVGYKTMGLTEHMPRTELSDLYPEEVSFLNPPSIFSSLSSHVRFETSASHHGTQSTMDHSLGA
jgi:histidinol-phosphatase (PHP family)